jgi:hypothetical protein
MYWKWKYNDEQQVISMVSGLEFFLVIIMLAPLPCILLFLSSQQHTADTRTDPAAPAGAPAAL